MALIKNKVDKWLVYIMVVFFFLVNITFIFSVLRMTLQTG